VIVAAIVPYLTSLSGGFALDDWMLIVNSPLVHKLSNIPEAFTRGFLPEAFGKDLVYYRPLITISYQLNYALSGANPFAFRFTNILLNMIAALLVFMLARRLTRSDMIAGVAGIAFGVIPNHSEAVAWISGRTDIMSVLFILSGLLIFIDTYHRSEFRWSGALMCSGLFFCGLLSKENALSLPIMIVAYVWIFGSGMRKREILKWIAVLAPPLVIYLVLRKLCVGAALDKHMFFMLKERLLGVGIAYAVYMRMLFVPMEGRVLYDVFPIGMRYPVIAIAAWAIPVGLMWIGIQARKRASLIAFEALWIFVTLLPVSNILPTSGPLPTERFAYLASVGSSIVVGWIVWRLYQLQPRAVRMWKQIIIVMVAWFAIYGTLLTISGNRFYMSNLGWARGVAETDTRFVMFKSQAGRYFKNAGYFKEAEKQYRAALELAPQEIVHYTDLANVLMRIDQPEQAIEVLESARNRFGLRFEVEYALGMASAIMGDLKSAETAFEQATKIRPQAPDAWLKLAKAKYKLGDAVGAIETYEKARSLGKLTARHHYELGLAYKSAGFVEKALRELEYASSQSEDETTANKAKQAINEIRR
jgi:Flp pilus assembly protein TadD